MSGEYTYIPDVSEQDVPADGILSRTLYADERVKVVQFAFAAGQELSEHTAAVPAILQILRGEARLTLGDDSVDVCPGAWSHMPAHLPHSVLAKTPVVMLLVLLRK